jgi:tetratricopeptide (TPR) repeat protein
LLVLLVGSLGGWLGYNTALQVRQSKYNSQVAMTAATQYQLGLEDQKQGRLEIARQRFAMVIQLDPKFPGAQDKLTEVMLALAQVKTPTIAPTPTIEITPTKDTRGVEELISQARQLMRNKDWDNALITLDALRKADITYQALEADGMYYIALRNRGVDKILKQGNLEGGMYDLALSERFGPLDKDAESYRTWARYYLTGASFWGIDWPKVIDYFSQIYPALPNLRDGSNQTATERYRRASISYGEQLMKEDKACDAVTQFQNALAISPDASAEQELAEANNICNPQVTEAPTQQTVTSTEVPVGAPSPTPETSQPAPTVTPNPAEIPTSVPPTPQS